LPAKVMMNRGIRPPLRASPCAPGVRPSRAPCANPCCLSSSAESCSGCGPSRAWPRRCSSRVRLAVLLRASTYALAMAMVSRSDPRAARWTTIMPALGGASSRRSHSSSREVSLCGHGALRSIEGVDAPGPAPRRRCCTSVARDDDPRIARNGEGAVHQADPHECRSYYSVRSRTEVDSDQLDPRRKVPLKAHTSGSSSAARAPERSNGRPRAIAVRVDTARRELRSQPGLLRCRRQSAGWRVWSRSGPPQDWPSAR